MKLKLSMVAALVLAGCAVQPTIPSHTGAGVQMDSQGSPMTQRYVIQSAKSDPVEIKGVTASSSSVSNPAWFAVSNTTDGNHHSAWGPDHDDDKPTLTLNLGGEHDLSALAIKLSGMDVHFDVAIWKDGEWMTVATDVETEHATLDFVDLPNHKTDKVQLTFHGKKLLVCEVKMFSDKDGGVTPTPMPSTTPTPTPSMSPSPTPAPSESPTPAPEQDCITLNGQGTIGELFGGQAPATTITAVNLVLSEDGSSGTLTFSDTAGSSSDVATVTSFERSGDTITISGTYSASDIPQGSSGNFELILSISDQEGNTFTAIPEQLTRNGDTEVRSDINTSNIEGSLEACEDE